MLKIKAMHPTAGGWRYLEKFLLSEAQICRCTSGLRPQLLLLIEEETEEKTKGKFLHLWCSMVEELC